MNKFKEKYREMAELYPIACSTCSYFGLALATTLGVFVLLVIVLLATGSYGSMETALDLKHNSIVILVPLWTLLALSGLCAMSGVLMYFHKYKRPKVKSAFRDALAPALDIEVGKKG